MAPRKLRISDLFDVSTIQGIRLSPDGAHGVVTVRKQNVKEQRNDSSLWLWAASDNSFRRLTKGPADSGAVWLDNSTILFTAAKREGDDEKSNKPFRKTRLYTISLNGGEVDLRCTLDGFVWGFEPSPKGDRIALIYSPNPSHTKQEAAVWEKAPRPVRPARPFFRFDGLGLLPDATHGLYILDCKAEKWGKLRKVLHTETQNFWSPVWTPNGRQIVVTRGEAISVFKPTEILLTDLRGNAEVLNAPKGFVAAYAVSPDGKQLAFAANNELTYSGAYSVPLGIRSMDPKDRKFRIVHKTDGRFANNDVLSDITPAGEGDYLQWRDNDCIVSLLAEHGHTRVVELKVSDPKHRETIAGGSGVVPHFGVHGDTVLYYAASPTNPGELYLAGREKPLSKLNVEPAKSFNIAPERWDVQSEKGVKVDTWLWATKEQLASKKKAALPLVIYVHGGPNTEAGDVPFHEYTWLAQNGFATIISNPRGSTGYGDEHGAAIMGNWGDRDIHDILAVRADTLKRYPQFDPERTFIVGGSYGGYMANMMVTRHPGVFRAGIAERCVSNFISFDGTSDVVGIFLKFATGLDHAWQDPVHAWKRSPISMLDKVIDPLFVIHSDNDWRCPLSQAEEVVSGLISTGKKLGDDLRFIIFRGESHGLSRGGRPENRRVRLEEILGWLKKHNTKRPRPRAKAKARPARKTSAKGRK